jgi:hypothetical protein
MIHLTLQSAVGDTIDLGSIEATNVGMEAQPGVTGLGLPPVEAQWVSGAGDGATFRGRRVLPRDIDIPIELYATSRADLKTQVERLSLALSGECTLRVVEAGSPTWSAKVNHVGGGGYATGEDTDGTFSWSTTITLRAGDPFWISDQLVESTRTGSAVSATPLSVANTGTADAYLMWEVSGPTLGFKAKRRGGGDPVLQYADFIPKGGKILVDTKRGTVVDELGNNRYAGLTAAPRFFRVPPGTTLIDLSWDQSSSDYLARVGAGRRNLVTNPAFVNDLSGWAVSGGVVRSTAQNGSLSFPQSQNVQGYASYALSGLVVGQTYQVSALTSTTFVSTAAYTCP